MKVGKTQSVTSSSGKWRTLKKIFLIYWKLLNVIKPNQTFLKMSQNNLGELKNTLPQLTYSNKISLFVSYPILT
jgi:hypothetical protein